ncbi:MAG: GNAT family N-acetyltransferase [Kineosporiaceae bacterium]|nr:GNAT family N-acetyltransferase [Aeromicrobium sp.]
MSVIVAPPNQLVAGQFELRAMVEGDWAVEVALSRDPEVLRWTHYRAHMTEQKARERLSQTTAAGSKTSTVRFLIADGDDVLGVAGVFVDPEASPEIYYALVQSGRGRGAAALAAQALSDWVLENGSPTVTLEIFCGNTASERVAARSGFILHRTSTTIHQGQTIATAIWGRTR